MTAGRQVRLDDDTLALVEAEAARESCSLSKATNRLLRRHAASPSVTPVVGPAVVTRPPDRSTRSLRGHTR